MREERPVGVAATVLLQRIIDPKIKATCLKSLGILQKLDTFVQVMQYFLALDGLRLLASLNIVLMHMDSSWCLGFARYWPVIGSLIQGPAFNASIFFVLGGYIYFNQLSKSKKPFSPIPFLKARWKKLYPLHLLSLALMGFAVYLRQEYYGDIVFLWKSIIAHLSLLWAFVPLDFHSLNEPSWALTPFFIAYATIGLFLRPLRNETRIPVLVLCLLLSLAPSVTQAIVFAKWGAAPGLWELMHTNPFTRVFEFYFGMVLARLFQVTQEQSPSILRGWQVDLGLLLGFVLAWAFTHLHTGYGMFLSWFGHQTLAVLLYGALIWGLSLHIGLVARLFASKWVSGVGRASFYPYLLHLPLITWTILGAQSLGFKGFFRIWWQPIFFIVILYGLSALHIRSKKKV